MKKNSIYLIILVFLIIGCTIVNNSVEEISTPITSSSIPSLTLLPTNTIAVSPTPQIIQPTPTIYLSPLPTLSFEQEEVMFYRFYNFIDQCRLPCLWGITPGLTTWAETKQFLEQFDYFDTNNKASWSITKTTNFDTYGWAVHNPNAGEDFALSILIEVQNNIVTAILLDHQLSKILFPLHRLFEEYGEPSKVLFDAPKNVGSIEVYFVDVFVLYEDSYIFSGYRFYEYASTNPESRRVCLHESLGEPLILWSSGNELNRDFSKSKLLSNFSEENEKTFYERFKYKGNKCFEVSKSAWD